MSDREEKEQLVPGNSGELAISGIWGCNLQSRQLRLKYFDSLNMGSTVSLAIPSFSQEAALLMSSVKTQALP